MNHITEYRKNNGATFDGYRVCITKMGITFCKYVSTKAIGWDEAKQQAIKIEQEIRILLSTCKTPEEILKAKCNL